MEGSPRRRWTEAALLAFALLLVPILVWIFVPARGALAPPRPRAPRIDRSATDRAGPGDVGPASARGASPRRVQVAAGGTDDGTGFGGEVQDPEGKPLAGASVTCVLGDREHSAESDEAGKFRLPAEAAGCKATARKQGFGPSGEEALRAGATNRLRLAPPTGIAGTVVDETGAPVMIYSIAVESFVPAGGAGDGGAAPPRKIALSVSDQDGAFAWSDLAPGRYDLTVSARNHPFARSRGIEVAPGAVTGGVRIALSLGTIVVGTITDARTKEPLGGAMVFADMGLALGLKVLPAFSEGGEYRLEGAPTDVFDLHVVRAGYEEHITRGVRAPAGGAPLRVDVAMLRPGEVAPAGHP